MQLIGEVADKTHYGSKTLPRASWDHHLNITLKCSHKPRRKCIFILAWEKSFDDFTHFMGRTAIFFHLTFSDSCDHSPNRWPIMIWLQLAEMNMPNLSDLGLKVIGNMDMNRKILTEFYHKLYDKGGHRRHVTQLIQTNFSPLHPL